LDQAGFVAGNTELASILAIAGTRAPVWPLSVTGSHKGLKELPMKDTPKQHADQERERIERKEDQVVVDSDESFPASDPPSFNPGVTGAPRSKKQKKPH
jgi:hypothetical protein